MVSGERESDEYLVAKGNTGDKSVDECPRSEFGEHKLMESKPENLEKGDPETADYSTCDKTMNNATDSYLSCFTCDSAWCQACVTVLENSG